MPRVPNVRAKSQLLCTDCQKYLATQSCAIDEEESEDRVELCELCASAKGLFQSAVDLKVGRPGQSSVAFSRVDQDCRKQVLCHLRRSEQNVYLTSLQLCDNRRRLTTTAEMALESGHQERTVRFALNRLEELGLIRRDKQGNAGTRLFIVRPQPNAPGRPNHGVLIDPTVYDTAGERIAGTSPGQDRSILSEGTHRSEQGGSTKPPEAISSLNKKIQDPINPPNPQVGMEGMPRIVVQAAERIACRHEVPRDELERRLSELWSSAREAREPICARDLVEFVCEQLDDPQLRRDVAAGKVRSPFAVATCERRLQRWLPWLKANPGHKQRLVQFRSVTAKNGGQS